MASYRSTVTGRDGFGQLLWAEWTKFRSVRGWVLGLLAAAVVIVLVCLLGAGGATDGGNGPKPPTVGGIPVRDSFRFVHWTLDGDGGITARVSSLRGQDGGDAEGWAKAGVVVKQDLTAGSSYAAVMLTPAHGVRMQYGFTEDVAGAPNLGGPHWLRLTRAGPLLTGFESADGSTWTEIGSVELPELAGSVQVGLFVTSPDHTEVRRAFGVSSETGHPESATASFDEVSLTGATTPLDGWRGDDVGRLFEGVGSGGAAGPTGAPDPFAAETVGTSTESGGVFTLTGSGDIAPFSAGGDPVQMSLSGVLVGLIGVVAVSVLFMTAEYKRPMIRATFAASPRRGRVLAAKAVVTGTVVFLATLPAVVVGLLLAQSRLTANGIGPPLFADVSLADGRVLRAVVGSALLLAVAGVVALALGAVFRNSTAAITVVLVLLVLPRLLVLVLPMSAGEWLLRVTPAAAFSMETTLTRYDQVEQGCLPESGCYPLWPWSGFGVLCGYAVVALGLAVWQLRRRDA